MVIAVVDQCRSYVKCKVCPLPFLWAWQVRVLQIAQEEQLQGQYVKGSISLDWMQKLSQLSWSEKGPELAKVYCKRQ